MLRTTVKSELANELKLRPSILHAQEQDPVLEITIDNSFSKRRISLTLTFCTLALIRTALQCVHDFAIMATTDGLRPARQVIKFVQEATRTVILQCH